MMKRLLRGLLSLVALDVVLASALILTSELSDYGDRSFELIAVLWAGSQDEWTPSTAERLDYARRLHQTSGKPILCVGGSRPMRSFSGAQRMCQALQDLDVPHHLLRVASPSNDTISNIASVEREMKELGTSSAVLVTDRLHALRISRLIPAASQSKLQIRPLRTRLDLRSIASLWLRSHHEALAYLSYAMPERWRMAILTDLRP